MYGLILLCIVAYIVYCIVVVKRYKESTYYRDTQLSYWAVRYDVGRWGEYLTYKYLQAYEQAGAKFLFNCYLDKSNGETTEVDVMMIHKSGIYVFESKNYSGWIFGNEKSKTWTQTLPQGKKSHKEHSLNPIMQNKLHIKWLVNTLKTEEIPIHSIIVFSERCTLKKVEVTSPNIKVIKRGNVKAVVAKIDLETNSLINDSEINRIYDKLYPYTQVSSDTKMKHVQNIQEHLENHEVPEVIAEVNKFSSEEGVLNIEVPLICPKCGSNLLLRTSRRGENAGKKFYGCQGYPKCRYIKNID